MRNIFIIFGTIIFFSFIFTSCKNSSSKNQKNKSSTEISTVKTDIVESKLDEAKKVAKTIFDYVEQAETKQITREQLDIKANPLQSHLDSLRLVLTATEIKELDSYRTRLVNEMIDRKIIRERK